MLVACAMIFLAALAFMLAISLAFPSVDKPQLIPTGRKAQHIVTFPFQHASRPMLSTTILESGNPDLPFSEKLVSARSTLDFPISTSGVRDHDIGATQIRSTVPRTRCIPIPYSADLLETEDQFEAEMLEDRVRSSIHLAEVLLRPMVIQAWRPAYHGEQTREEQLQQLNLRAMQQARQAESDLTLALELARAGRFAEAVAIKTTASQLASAVFDLHLYGEQSAAILGVLDWETVQRAIRVKTT